MSYLLPDGSRHFPVGYASLSKQHASLMKPGNGPLIRSPAALGSSSNLKAHYVQALFILPQSHCPHLHILKKETWARRALPCA